jgi:hypothetical protein
VTNSYTPEKTEVSGTKTWIDNNDQDGKRPESITINLLANGKVIDSVVVTEADGWKFTFTDLDKYANGEEIVYTITEDAVDGYTTTIDGFNVTNSYTPEEVKVNVNKVWDDDDDFDGKRPGSITINLFADGEKIGSAVVTAADGWKVSFENLPKYKNGKEIVYTITEDAVAEYTSTIAGDAANGYTVTNQYLPEIEEEDPPLDDLPDTGDTLSNMLIMTMVCALGFVTCLAKRKQEN